MSKRKAADHDDDEVEQDDAAEDKQPADNEEGGEEEDPEPDEAQERLAEAVELIEQGEAEDTDRVIALLEECIALSEQDASDGTRSSDGAPRPVPSLAHTYLGKIREEQALDDDDDANANGGGGECTIESSSSLAAARRHYEAALACWPQNATAAYALARLLKPGIATAADLARYEALLRTVAAHAPEEDEETRRLGTEDLALLLLQSGEPAAVEEADGFLRGLGFTHRLAREVLAYRKARELSTQAKLGEDAAPFIHVYDGVLSPAALRGMQRFLGPTSPFWREHGYWRPDTGYFSYLYDLGAEPRIGIEALIRQVLFPLACRAFPRVAEATTAEWWAHCRRHNAAHQLHYDSLDEGRGYVQHPLASCVLYLSEEGVGGPTLMTDQELKRGGLATKGWFCHGRLNRACVFDATYLHGVVPGRGLPPASDGDGNGDGKDPRRRITFMVGFWRHRVKPKPRGEDGQPGASMDLAPLLAAEEEADGKREGGGGTRGGDWLALARGQVAEGGELSGQLAAAAAPGTVVACGGLEGALPRVWECIDGEDGDGTAAGAAPPPYDQCFQGF